LDDLIKYLKTESGTDGRCESVLVLDEAFIFPHVYEECVSIKAAAGMPLRILLLVERRTRTRWDWNGADRILRMPATVEAVADLALRELDASRGE
jgi:hypothetical protein